MIRRQAAFLFGSGISFPSGLPDVYKITDAARKEEWHLHTDGIFRRGEDHSANDIVTPIVKAFLEEIYALAEDYLTEIAGQSIARKPHYEDLFSLSEQAWRPKMDHSPNLAAVEFVRRLSMKTEKLSSNFKANILGEGGFSGLAHASCDFLHWVVHHELSSQSKRRGLNLISNVAYAVESLDIFTLNHDLLLEEQLKFDGLPEIECGFEDFNHGEFSTYQPGWWQNGDQRKKIRLFKLHGSLNWWLYDFPNWARQYAIPHNHPFHSRDQDGRFVRPLEWKAAFLSGTIVKELAYGLALWSELFEGFRSQLSKHDNLICSGYGFGDTGVNLRLRQWANDNTRRRLIILADDKFDNYFSEKPHWLKQLAEDNKIVFIPKYLEKCLLSDLAPYFDPL